MKYIFVSAFVVMVAAQWIVPLSMIRDSNKTIEEGTEYRFKTAPVDPADPFRGKYVTLSFDMENYHPADTNHLLFGNNSDVYALLDRDSAGYAKITKLVEQAPAGDETDYMQVTYKYGFGGLEPGATLQFPFSRFYLEESKASEAQQLYWQNQWGGEVNCYAKVMVLEGDAKLVDVVLRDSSIVDIVQRINEGKKRD